MAGYNRENPRVLKVLIEFRSYPNSTKDLRIIRSMVVSKVDI